MPKRVVDKIDTYIGRKRERERETLTGIVRVIARAPECYGGFCEVGVPGEVDEVVIVIGEVSRGALRIEPVDVGIAGREEDGREERSAEGKALGRG